MEIGLFFARSFVALVELLSSLSSSDEKNPVCGLTTTAAAVAAAAQTNHAAGDSVHAFCRLL